MSHSGVVAAVDGIHTHFDIVLSVDQHTHTPFHVEHTLIVCLYFACVIIAS